MRPHLLALVMLTPALLAGCLQDADEPVDADRFVASTADEAGARSGSAPAAPKSAYRVQAGDPETPTEATAHPLSMRTNAAREPVTHTFSGTFTPLQCTLAGNLDVTTSSWRWHDAGAGLKKRDAFLYDIELAFTNTDDSWAELHLYYGIGSKNGGHSTSVGQTRGEILQNFTGQSFRVSSNEAAWVAVGCWYGAITTPLSYTVTVTYTFAEDAVPAEVPILMTVPEGATRLFVSGLALDPSRPVTSHYRVFGVNDDLLCECALNSNQQTGTFALPGPGDYVVLVDHTDNGFVTLALDVPPVHDLMPLETRYNARVVLSSTFERDVDQTFTVALDAVPLNMGTWYSAPTDLPVGAGTGMQMSVTVENGRGVVTHMAHAGFLLFRLQTPLGGGNTGFMSLPVPGEWAYHVDHHNFDNGDHHVHVKADAFRGDLYLWTRDYVR